MLTIILEILIFISCLVILNSFILYPLILFLLNRWKPRKYKTGKELPPVSILIAAHNEEKVIANRIDNIANLDYDFSKIEVFVGSDNSDDATNQILQELVHKYQWLKIFISETRMGKAGILNKLINSVSHDILVLTDANTEFQKDALRQIVKDFADERIGGVCGKLVLLDDEAGKSEGVEESKYWRYETFIKQSEGALGILLAANGGFFALRKNLYKEIPTTLAVTDDLFLSLNVVAQGYNFTYCDNAVAYEYTGKDVNEEYQRKVRFSATNFQTLINFKDLLLKKRNILTYAFFSHKVTRWFLPHILVLIFLLSLLSATSSSFAFLLFVLQVMFYWAAFGGFIFSLLKIRIPLFSMPYFFVISNIAIAAGFVRFLKKQHTVIWKTAER